MGENTGRANRRNGHPVPQRRRLSRRAVLRGLVRSSAGLTAALAVGCGSKEQAGSPAAMEPRHGGVFRYPARSIFPPYERGLDPHIQPASQTGRMRLFYQTLVRADPRTWQVEPELAQNWEQVSQTELIFTLAPGIKFHDKPPANGRDLRPEDVVFSLERVRTPDPRFVVRSLLDSVDRIEAVDRSRVRLTLKQPDVAVLDNLAAFSLAILAPEVVERAGERFGEADAAVGTGPFILREKTEVSATHLRNPQYWKPGLPYLDQVLIAAFGDEEARWAAFLAGGLDLNNRVPGTVAVKYSAEQGQFLLDRKFPAEWGDTPSMRKFFANVKRKPLDDPRVYRALRLLIDHDEVAKADTEIQTGRAYHSQAFPSSLARWDFSQEEYVMRFLEWKRPKDEAVKVALDLLSAAGFTRDKPLAIPITTSNEFDRAGQLLQAQWRRLGQGVIQPDLRIVESAILDRVRSRREFDTLVSGAAAPAAEADTFLRTFYHSKGSRNYADWSDAKADDLIDRQRMTFDTEQRKALIKDLLPYLIENAPAVTWGGSYELTAAQPKVKGWVPEADSWASSFQYERVWWES